MCEWIVLQVFSPPGALSAEARMVFPRQELRAPKGEWWFPTGRAVSAEGAREWPYTEATPSVELPRLARPKGCFDTSAEWS